MQNLRRIGLFLVLFGFLFPVRAVYAGQKIALEYYEKGSTAYNLNRFHEAIDHYQTAYEAYAAPEFLFNIGQAYRQLNGAEQCRALNYYRRYLGLKPDAPNRTEVENRIADLKIRCEDHLGPLPPAGTVRPGAPASEPGNPNSGVFSNDGVPSGVSASLPEVGRARPLFIANAELGAAFISVGGVNMPARMAVRAGLAYQLTIGAFSVEPGVLFSFSSVSFQFKDVKGQSQLPSVLANVTGSYTLANFRFRAAVGFGALFLLGLEEANPFTVGEASSSAITLPHLRTTLGVDYALMDDLFFAFSPATFAYSPRGGALKDEVDNIVSFELTAGFSCQL